MLYLGVAQLVARYLGVVEAASSSLVTQTMMSIHNGLDVMNTHFSFVFASFSMYGQVRVNLPACIMRVMPVCDTQPQHPDGYLPTGAHYELECNPG